MNNLEALPHRLEEIRGRLEQACQRSGRSSKEVTLVGVSKRQSVEKLLCAYDAGLRVFGENRVQEAESKIPRLPADAQWHLIGPLQSNKVKKAVGLFQVIHTLDRLKICRRLERETQPLTSPLTCFLEINVGLEESKHGFEPDKIDAALRELATLQNLRIVGLMAIPPYATHAAQARPWFQKLRLLRDRLCSTPGFEDCPGWLSMGMSSDFEVAIEEGATHVRVGTAIFGERETASK